MPLSDKLFLNLLTQYSHMLTLFHIIVKIHLHNKLFINMLLDNELVNKKMFSDKLFVPQKIQT